MLLNFGGNVGMYGRMEKVIEGYYAAREHPNGRTLRGVGITMEGIENNPVMYELLLELPWRSEKFTASDWIKDYAGARYGKMSPTLCQAWEILIRTAYHCPRIQEGTTESVFCARPQEVVNSASSWGTSELYYRPEEFRKAAELMIKVAPEYKGNNNFEYDLVDVVRQCLTDKGNELLKETMAAYRNKKGEVFKRLKDQFLELILQQDRLLSTRREFRVGTWLEQARTLGNTEEEKRLYEWNARLQITTWGDRIAADEGGLRDYAHREWAGLLKDFYYPRWKYYFDRLTKVLKGEESEGEIDWYSREVTWTLQQNTYSAQPEGEVIPIVIEIYDKIFKE